MVLDCHSGIDGQRGGMELNEGRRRHQCASPVRAPRGSGVGVLGKSRFVEDRAVATRGEDNRMSCGGSDFAGHKVARHDSLGASVRDNEIEHLGPRMQVHSAGSDLALQSLRRRYLQLLPRLPARIVRARNLDATK